eukprot:4376291-Lingulodinium_polyedra.AAC.1
MVSAWTARFGKTPDATTMERVSKRISEQLSCENCSEMRSDLHSGAPRRAFRNARAPRVSHHAVADA